MTSTGSSNPMQPMSRRDCEQPCSEDGRTSPDSDTGGDSSSNVVVVVPSSSARRRKTNSERGKEFRAKRRLQEVALLEMISSLRQDVNDLRFLRDIRGETALTTRNSLDGSVVKLVREYFALFAGGRRPPRRPMGGPDDLFTKQEAFLQQSTDSALMFGDASGAAALLDQWERYTQYHATFSATVVSVDVAGSVDAPIVTVCSRLCVTLSRQTFQFIFPHVAGNHELIARHVGKQITYCGVNQFQFSEDGKRIVVYDSDVDFVSAFLAAGVSLADVALLMMQAKIADQYLLGEEPHQATGNPPWAASVEEIIEESAPKRSRPITMEDLLN